MRIVQKKLGWPPEPRRRTPRTRLNKKALTDSTPSKSLLESTPSQPTGVGGHSQQHVTIDEEAPLGNTHSQSMGVGRNQLTNFTMWDSLAGDGGEPDDPSLQSMGRDQQTGTLWDPLAGGGGGPSNPCLHSMEWDQQTSLTLWDSLAGDGEPVNPSLQPVDGNDRTNSTLWDFLGGEPDNPPLQPMTAGGKTQHTTLSGRLAMDNALWRDGRYPEHHTVMQNAPSAETLDA